MKQATSVHHTYAYFSNSKASRRLNRQHGQRRSFRKKSGLTFLDPFCYSPETPGCPFGNPPVHQEVGICQSQKFPLSIRHMTYRPYPHQKPQIATPMFALHLHCVYKARRLLKLKLETKTILEFHEENLIVNNEQQQTAR